MHRGPRLVQLGFLLFLLGLLTGLAIPAFANPRMGLSSHLQAVMSGLFLVALGLAWPRLRLSTGLTATVFWLALWGAFAGWGTTLLSATLGAGATRLPIAAAGFTGSPGQETLIQFLLISVALADVVALVLVVWGLRGSGGEGATA